MKMSRSDSMKISIPVFSTLGVAFIILKLCKVIDWSWWWVTAPFWGAASLALAIMLIIMVVSLAVIALSFIFKKRK